MDSLVRGERTLQSITLDVLNGAMNDDARIVANKLLAAQYFTDEVERLARDYSSGGIDAARAMLELVDATPASVAAAVAEAARVLEQMQEQKMVVLEHDKKSGGYIITDYAGS